jgi:DNA replication protein DnaC
MEIKTQLSKLRLHGMSQGWQALQETRRHLEINLPEGLEVLLLSEEEERDNRRFQRLQKSARFRYQASTEELNMESARGMDKSLITTLAKGSYIKKGESVLVTGSTGCGKSFLVSALGHRACTQGYKVGYYNLQKLMLKTKMCRADGTIIKFMDKISKTDLLIMDDFGLTNLEQQHRLDLLEIIEDRHGRKSTLIASQLPVASWYEVIGEETIADAILDRLIHTSHRVELKGESMRRKKL